MHTKYSPHLHVARTYASKRKSNKPKGEPYPIDHAKKTVHIPLADDIEDPKRRNMLNKKYAEAQSQMDDLNITEKQKDDARRFADSHQYYYLLFTFIRFFSFFV
jgi:hypothetical protein